MKELLKEWLELSAKMHWLKTIDRTHARYMKLKKKADREAHAIRKLIERFNELYPDDKLRIKWEDTK